MNLVPGDRPIRACSLGCPDTCSWTVAVKNGEYATVDERDSEMGRGDNRVRIDRTGQEVV